MKNSTVLSIILICASCFLCFFTGTQFQRILNPPKNTEARVEMWHLSSQLSLGDSTRKVTQIFRAANYSALEIKVRERNLWVVKTPSEIAANWLLYIEFQNDEIQALRFRTPDDTRFRTNERFAPPDQVAKGWKSPREEMWKLPEK